MPGKEKGTCFTASPFDSFCKVYIPNKIIFKKNSKTLKMLERN